jgi:hypothetical protein
LTTYRLVRRLLNLPCWAGRSSLDVAELFSASVAALKRTSRVPRSYAVRWAGERDLPALTAFFGPDRKVDERFARGDVCLIALVREEICAAVWFIPGPGVYSEDAQDFGRVFRIPAGHAFSYDGKGLRWGAWGTLMARAPRYLAELGVDEVVTLIDYGNTASSNAHRSLGYRHIGLLGCVRLLSWMQPFHKANGQPWRISPGQMGPLLLGRTSASAADASRTPRL